MATKKKMLQAAAGNAGGGLDITDVFSTYLYTGTGSTQTVTNDIDLEGEGGLVWLKARNNTQSNWLYDSERSSFAAGLRSDTVANEYNPGTSVTSVSSSGFTLGTYGEINQSSIDYASWTFRKAPKFFDVVTYTGDGVAGREIAHNLGSVPGCFILKATSTTGDWIVYHRGLSDPSNKALALHLTNAELDNTYFNDTDPTATHFVVGGQGLGINNSGTTYVAYLFAHNDGDGEFGPSGDQDIIKCGSFTFPSSGDVEIDLGFEPQWVITKRIDGTSPWWIADTMRGWAAQETGSALSSSTGGNLEALFANTAGAEVEYDYGGLTSTGFKWASNFNAGTGNTKYIYIAIRRGTLAPPESGTEVFNPTYAYEFDIEGNTSSGNGIHGYLGNPTDLYIQGYLNGSSLNSIVRSRLTGGNYLVTNATNAETTSSINFWDNNVGSGFETSNSVNTSLITWNWKRAPGFFDVVAYTGEGANTVINHNLDAIPEMVWVKNRGRAQNWNVYHKDLENNGDPASECRLFLSTDSSVSSGPVFWGTHTNTTFTMTAQNFQTNYLNDTYIAYLFATVPGISKVGSYTGGGTPLSIDCGFSSGARFVLIKRTDQAYNWFVWDTERGITASYDPVLALNTTDAELSLSNILNPYSAGFQIIDSYTGVNESGGNYIFYAIA